MGRGASKIGGEQSVKPITADNYKNWGSSTKGKSLYSDASKNYTEEYEPMRLGVVTKREAGIVYKAVKNENVQALPEMKKMLYDEADRASYKLSSRALSNESYNQASYWYDKVYDLCHSLVNNDYKTAQALINDLEYDGISSAGKKSRWYKYRK